MSFMIFTGFVISPFLFPCGPLYRGQMRTYSAETPFTFPPLNNEMKTISWVEQKKNSRKKRVVSHQVFPPPPESERNSISAEVQRVRNCERADSQGALFN